MPDNAYLKWARRPRVIGGIHAEFISRPFHHQTSAGGTTRLAGERGQLANGQFPNRSSRILSIWAIGVKTGFFVTLPRSPNGTSVTHGVAEIDG